MNAGIQAILMGLVEKQADDLREKVMEYLASDEMAEEIATKINQKIDIPFVSEEKEQEFFEKCVDIVTDLMEGLFKK
jgi:hypothetical protein|tara:strand:- start:929 stop:1159 length:231 start_codon:yes stop_codon:yes gene_type:complete